ncbi:hypothetical protein MA16_Dca018570 [Dendrobium catenatum]|uniref:Uncharacterized protein n=1 Tax=Dendrobium catenatum TaxID=906689 RepID=A0A2I0WQY9_9ASPA|nr:hypothetical protein MA16_Dca018570 [Dendrobium catenatum]
MESRSLGGRGKHPLKGWIPSCLGIRGIRESIIRRVATQDLKQRSRRSDEDINKNFQRIYHCRHHRSMTMIRSIYL